VLERTPSGAVISVTEGDPVSFRCAARLPKGGPGDQVTFAWTIDGQPVKQDDQPGAAGASELVVPGARPGMYRVVARVSEVDEAASLAEWTLVVTPATPLLVAAAEPAAPARPASAGHAVDTERRPAAIAELPTAPEPVDLGRERNPLAVADDVVPAEVARTPAPPEHVGGVNEGEVRRWLDEYAQAWSRKDSDALRRMGHVQTASQTERLRRYFQSVNDIRVDVRVVALHVEGDRASVDLERTETVTDPSGDRQTLRSPPVHREIERGPEGLRFTEPAKS
jgi:hypothetical protein